ncbi:PQQ-dependent sugar dehydrogenase [Chondrinema litorale]|uniref:PQQ-dependent sugar dehydrogenase n=1 Tax=Chondrinema litorale TaxID=2994555 RepID=UPI0025436817|nr:PQQ-dependent sugar dehydrogenase [Chondrinema litorale]UZR98736.1 PQQ-dependent sugar dehydrogenase [Chondrinema litorale]
MAQLSLENSEILISEVAADLEIPWEITWGPDNYIWYTEQKGTVSKVNQETKELKQLLYIPEVHYQKSRGLLGMAIHPDFEQNPYVYLHYTFIVKGEELFKDETKSRLVRYSYDAKQDTLLEPITLLDNIPGKTFHNGSRILISDNRKIFLSTGDAGNTKGSQDVSLISGKILRLNLDGSIPDDNPIKDSYIYSWGHRNPQGLAFGKNGLLYSSEHGPNNDDELNLIEAGNNYGWPNVEGFCDKSNEQDYCKDSSITEPLYAWTPTIAPSGIAYYNHDQIPEWKNSIIVGALKGRSVRVLKLDEEGKHVINHEIYFQKTFGRIRDICVSPEGDVYLATSNQDWHPKYMPEMYDHLPLKGFDKIIKLSKVSSSVLAELKPEKPLLLEKDMKEIELQASVQNRMVSAEDAQSGENLYLQHCASCHQANGQGSSGLIPPLAKTDWVTGSTDRLASIVLNGTSEAIKVNGEMYEQEMPGYASSLEDESIAQILTYIRSNFGNDASAILPAEVGEARKGLKL